MTKEEKRLLLKDLCARLPYVIYYDLSYYGHTTRAVIQEFITANEPLDSLVRVNTIVEPISYENIKPYLRPLSSMTEKEKKEYCDLQAIFLCSSQYPVTDAYEIFDWLNAHHFDYRGLISMGLALEAKEGMYEG